ncbi:hypothetical protein ScPMuIL_004802 [Solemya velum]
MMASSYVKDTRLIEQLPNVFGTLVVIQKPITDDTCLNKLQDILKTKLTTVEIVEKSGAGNFLQMVASDNGDLQDSVLVFALAFTGNLGSKELVFNHYQTDITSLCKTVWACERMKEPSIAAAAFTSLSQFTSHPTGLAWILSEDFLDKAWTFIEHAKSLFLIQKVTDFLISLYTGLSEHVSRWQSSCAKIQEAMAVMLHKIEDLLKNDFSANCSMANSATDLSSPLVECALQLLKVICLTDRSSSQAVVQSQSMTENLLSVFYRDSRSIFTAALDVLDALFLESSFTSSAMYASVLELPHKLLAKEALWKSQKMAVRLLMKYSSGVLTEDQIQQLEETVLIPLFVVLDRTPEAVTLSVDVWQQTIESTSRSTWTQMIWHTVDCSDRLNFKKLSKVEMLLATLEKSLLECGNTKAKFLVKNRKIQQKILEYLQTLSADKELDAKIFSTVLRLMKEIGIDSPTFSKCLRCIHPRMPLIVRMEEEQGRQLSETLKMKMCDMQWEVRDSTAEFLGSVVEIYNDDEIVMHWIMHNNLDIQVHQMVSDKDSYVRATAIRFVEMTLLSMPIWDNLCQLLQNSKGPVEDILRILLRDSEAFPRRTAVVFMKSLFLHKHHIFKKIEPEFLTTMGAAMGDFDWEVKIKCLELWGMCH